MKKLEEFLRQELGMKKIAPWILGSSDYDSVAFARLAYESYGDHAGWKNYQGLKMPDWLELGDDIRSHWVAAIERVLGSSDA